MQILKNSKIKIEIEKNPRLISNLIKKLAAKPKYPSLIRNLLLIKKIKSESQEDAETKEDTG